MAKYKKKKSQVCVGCCDPFITYRNYDYCVDCAVNGSRYLTKSNCSECDGSGIIKFPHQKPRPCKLCYLTKNPMNKTEKYWNEVNQLAQEKIYHLLTTHIPFQNIKLITEPWRFAGRQEKLSGLFLARDVDYRTLLSDIENQYYEAENQPDQEVVAEEIALWYCRLVMKSLISDLSDYTGYDPSFFSDLTNSDY